MRIAAAFGWGYHDSPPTMKSTPPKNSTNPAADFDVLLDFLTQQQMDVMLDQGVAQAVLYAREHSPYYQKTLADAPQVTCIADLKHLPLTTKQQVSADNEQFWCVSQNQIQDIATTSGTTGTPTLYPITHRDMDRLALNEYLCFTAAGVKPGDVVILAVTLDKCFMAGLAYFEGLRKIGATVIRVGAGSPAMLLSMVQRLNANTIVSVPSFLKRVASYAKQEGIDVAHCSVRKLICIGEPMRDTRWQLNALGNDIANAWNATIHSTYGVTELATSLCECAQGNGGHLHPQLLHIEILDDQHNPVPDGTVGQLVATTIGVTGMPLIRFATGDMTFMTHAPCTCGRITPRIGPILGRRDQAMKLKGTTVYPTAVQRSLQSIPQILDYVMIATTPTTLCDELEVVVAWRGEESHEIATEMILARLAGDLKVSPRVRLAPLAEIQKLGHSRELRKQRVFIDQRKL